MSTCKVNIINENDCENTENINGIIKGGVKFNFDFVSKKSLRNEVLIRNHTVEIHTEFEFSKKAKLVLPLYNTDNTEKVLQMIIKKFQIVDSEKIEIYERELSLTLHEIFYRKLEANENPLTLFILWKLNQERKTMVITDHNPNERKYEKHSIPELQERLENLDCEEAKKFVQLQKDKV